MTRVQQLEEFEELFAKLRLANQAMPVLVEGARDEAALRQFGLTGTVLLLNRGDSLVTLCDRLARSHRQLVLLTDWDDKGRVLERRLRQCLEAGGVRVDGTFWRNLQRLCGGVCRTVEGLPAFRALLEEGD